MALALMVEDGAEVEVEIPGKYEVTPALRRAVKAVPGVVEAEEV